MQRQKCVHQLQRGMFLSILWGWNYRQHQGSAIMQSSFRSKPLLILHLQILRRFSFQSVSPHFRPHDSSLPGCQHLFAMVTVDFCQLLDTPNCIENTSFLLFPFPPFPIYQWSYGIPKYDHSYPPHSLYEPVLFLLATATGFCLITCSHVNPD